MTVLPHFYRRSVVSNYLSVSVQALVTVVMTPVLTSALGTTGYGVWTLALSVVLYLEVLEFGFAKTTIRYVAHYEAQRDRDGVRRTITTSFALLTIPALVAMIVGVVVAAAFPSLFDLDPQIARTAQLVCLLFTLDLALSIPSDTFGATLQALHRFDLVNATLIAVALAQALAWSIVIALGGGLVALASVTVVIGLLGQLSRFVLARRVLEGRTVARRAFDRRLVRPLGKLTAWFFVRDVAEVLVHRIDALVVGLVVGVPEAGIYAVGQKLSLLAERATWPVTVSFFPQMAGLSADAESSKFRDTVVVGTRIALGVAGPLCLTLMVLAHPAIAVWVDDAFLDAASVVALLAAALVLKALTRTGVLALEGMGQARFPALVFAAEALVNLVLSIALGRTMGLTGVALATLLAAGIAELALILPYLCRKLSVSLAGFVVPVFRAHLPGIAAGGVVGIAVRPHLTNAFFVAGGAIAIIGAYLGTFLVTGLSDLERRHLLGLLRGRRGSVSVDELGRHAGVEPPKKHQ